jgi:hypothetical protein
MSVQVKRRRDTAANISSFTPAQGEIIVDTTNNRMIVGDGATVGGFPAAKLSEVMIALRRPVADVAATVVATDRILAYTSLTAARAVTLCAASAFPTGVVLTVVDETGSCSGSNYISINRAGTDTICGSSNAVLNAPYMSALLISDGVSKWTLLSNDLYDEFVAIGIGTSPDASNPLSVAANQTLFNARTVANGGTGDLRQIVNKATSTNTASFLFQDGFSGRAEFGLCGDDNFHMKVSPDGSSWKDAVDISSTTGQASFNYGIASGEAIGFRNRLRNANFAINQRAVSGTVTLAAGIYGHDGVKAGASGATYTFAATGLDTTLTITAGSLILPIETMLIEGGTYTLSQAGTAQARVWQGTGYSGSGSYASSPITVTGLTAATQTNVEFSTGTVLRPQFEPGAVATAFERRPPGVELGMCQRYFWQGAFPTVTSPVVGNYQATTFYLPQQMRSSPTVAIVGTPTYVNSNSFAANASGLNWLYMLWNVTAAGGYFYGAVISATSEL